MPLSHLHYKVFFFLFFFNSSAAKNGSLGESNGFSKRKKGSLLSPDLIKLHTRYIFELHFCRQDAEFKDEYTGMTSLKEKNLPVDHNWLLHPLPRLLATSSFVIPLRHGALSDNYLDLIALFL